MGEGDDGVVAGAIDELDDEVALADGNARAGDPSEKGGWLENDDIEDF